MKERIIYLDLARALSVIWIVGILHTIGFVMNPQLLPPIVVKIIEAITVSCLATFTFLSGYFVAGKPIQSWHDVIAFYKRRLIRFALLYTIACVSLYIAGILLDNDVRWFWSINQLAATLVGVSGLIPNYQPATFWYFSMIILFYILTPFIMFAKSEKWKLLVSTVILSLLFVETITVGADIRLPFYFIFYVCGAFCNGNVKFTSSHIFLLASLFLSLSFAINMEYYIALQNILIGILGVQLILSISLKICQTRIVPVLSFIAYSSMCAYLFHRHIYAFIKKLCNDEFWPIYVCPIAVVSAFVLGYLIQLAYDNAINKLIPRKIS